MGKRDTRSSARLRPHRPWRPLHLAGARGWITLVRVISPAERQGTGARRGRGSRRRADAVRGIGSGTERGSGRFAGGVGSLQGQKTSPDGSGRRFSNRPAEVGIRGGGQAREGMSEAPRGSELRKRLAAPGESQRCSVGSCGGGRRGPVREAVAEIARIFLSASVARERVDDHVAPDTGRREG